jgi:amino acid transporter
LPEATSNPPSAPRPRRWTIFAAALLLIALTLVVIYTGRGAFSSPLAIVVVAAIGLAALLLQLRLRQGAGSQAHAPMWLNVLGLMCALAAVFADLLHLSPSLMLVSALGAVICFAASGAVVLRALRKQR